MVPGAITYCTKNEKYFCNVQEKYLTPDQCYAIIPKVQGNTLDRGGLYERV